MSNTLAAILGALVFGLILSVWNWVIGTIPGSPSSGFNLIVLLVALIAAIVTYLKFTGDY